jgi:hypothetical protein
MPQDEKRDPRLRILGLVFGTLALWAITYVVTSRMLHHHATTAKFRAAAVIIGVLGFVTWQSATAKIIDLQDEFTRRIHLIAVAIAFAATALFIFTVDLLQRAGFIDYILLRTVWVVMLCIWWLAIMGAEWYYRR